MLTPSELRPDVRYYCTRIGSGRETSCRLTGEFPCYEFSADGFGPSAKLSDFENFELVPTREQWEYANSLREDMRAGLVV